MKIKLSLAAGFDLLLSFNPFDLRSLFMMNEERVFRMSLLRRIFRLRTIVQFYHLIVLVMALISGYILRGRQEYRDLWIISERYDEARDNGYHLFKYIKERDSNIKAYYVISKKSVDREKVNEYGNVINFGSFKHYLYYVLADKIASTHVNGGLPDDRICPLLEKLKPRNTQRIMLRHGIAKDFLPKSTYAFTKAKVFVCGALPEYRFVKEHFGYPEGHVKYLGFCRFDNLHQFEIKKQILLMPTYRLWLKSNMNLDIRTRKFLESQYFKCYNSLLMNEDLIQILEKTGHTLVFYPHYEIQHFIGQFNSISTSIIIADRDKYDVQQLLKESCLLVTDYSSVYFDFAYMRKPVLYYQFDYEEYRRGHYQQGYFDYGVDGFGPVVKDEESLVREIINSIHSGCRLDEYYKGRIDNFFPLYDQDNCKRNFEAICDLK